MRLKEYAAQVPPEQYQKMTWPDQDEPRTVYVHVVHTRVCKLCTCQNVIARFALVCPLKAVRYWGPGDLDGPRVRGDAPTLLAHIAACWDIEILFGVAKDLLGLDRYTSWVPSLICASDARHAACAFLDQEHARLQHDQHVHVTIGDARREVQRSYWWHVVDWIHQQFLSGVTPDALHALLVA